MCGEYEQIVDHLFSCPIGRAIWFASVCSIRMDSYQPQSKRVWLEWWLYVLSENKSHNEVIVAMVVGILWFIWFLGFWWWIAEFKKKQLLVKEIFLHFWSLCRMASNFGGCVFGCRIRAWNKQIMGCYSRLDLCHLKGKLLSFHLEKRRWQSRERGS